MTGTSSLAQRRAAKAALVSALPSALIPIGQFFFRFRNAMFPVVIALTMLAARPQALFPSRSLDELVAALGAILALLGEAVRLTTIGFRYIERGGRNRRVFASRLVRRGIYGLTRNPMYLGNMLIASGICLMTTSLRAYTVVIPLFMLIYHAIVAAEEDYLRGRFGRGYAQYCATVNRFVPSFRNLRRAFAGMRFNWRRAVRQDLSTIVGLAMGLILVPVWRVYFLDGLDAATARLPVALTLVAATLAFYAWLYHLKKRGALL